MYKPAKQFDKKCKIKVCSSKGAKPTNFYQRIRNLQQVGKSILEGIRALFSPKSDSDEYSLQIPTKSDPRMPRR